MSHLHDMVYLTPNVAFTPIKTYFAEHQKLLNSLA